MQDEHDPIDCDISDREALAAEGFEPTTQPPLPTDARPGSEEKIRVMQKRYRLRMHLHHPDDGKLDDENAPSTWLKDQQALEAELDFYTDFDMEAGNGD